MTTSQHEMTTAQRLAEVRSGKKRERYTSHLMRKRKGMGPDTTDAVPRVVKIDWNLRSDS